MELQELKKLQAQSIKGLRRVKVFCINNFEEFPCQIPTSTNTGHVRNFEDTNLDFGINIHQIFSWARINELKEDRQNKLWKKLIYRIKKEIIENKLCFVFMPSFFKSSGIGLRDISNSIELQISSDIKPISLMIPKNIKPKLAKEIISKICKKYKDREIIVFIDMNDLPLHFEEIYLHSIKQKNISKVGFIFRIPSEKNIENFNFIAKRGDDEVLRIMVGLYKRSKQLDDNLPSFFLYLLGFDAFSFRTIPRYYNSKIDELATYMMGAYKLKQLEEFGDCDCKAHKGRNVYAVAEEYYKKKLSSIPTSIHDILKINDEFKSIRERIDRGLTIDELKKEIGFEDILSKALQINKSKR